MSKASPSWAASYSAAHAGIVVHARVADRHPRGVGDGVGHRADQAELRIGGRGAARAPRPSPGCTTVSLFRMTRKSPEAAARPALQAAAKPRFSAMKDRADARDRGAPSPRGARACRRSIRCRRRRSRGSATRCARAGSREAEAVEVEAVPGHDDRPRASRTASTTSIDRPRASPCAQARSAEKRAAAPFQSGAARRRASLRATPPGADGRAPRRTSASRPRGAQAEPRRIRGPSRSAYGAPPSAARIDREHPMTGLLRGSSVVPGAAEPRAEGRSRIGSRPSAGRRPRRDRADRARPSPTEGAEHRATLWRAGSSGGPPRAARASRG